MEGQPLWPEWLEQHIRRVTGPEDCPDTNVNGDPDSTLGDDAEEGEFEEMHDWPDPDFEGDDDDEPEGETDEE